MRHIFNTLLIFTFLVSLAGCAIEEVEGGHEGFLFVSAVDTLGAEITGATVLVDNVERAERTPAILNGLRTGTHEVTVRKLGFFSKMSEAVITSGDTTVSEFTLTPVAVGQTGILAVTSNPSGARVLMDGHAVEINGELARTPANLYLPWGVYQLSVHLEGHATVSPLLPSAEVRAGETTDFEFTLAEVETAQEAGKLPFDFTRENVEGDSVRLSDLTGYVVLVNFWYADCTPCIHEFPGIENVYRDLGSSGFKILAINPMFPDDRDEVLRVRSELGLTFQLLLDWDRYVTTTLYGVNPFPRNILVDRTGKIAEVLPSVLEEELRGKVNGLLSQSEN